jgi:hypothetical protein
LTRGNIYSLSLPTLSNVAVFASFEILEEGWGSPLLTHEYLPLLSFWKAPLSPIVGKGGLISGTFTMVTSMTSLLTHMSHILPGLPLGPKLITSPLKKSCGQLSKSCQKWQNSDFQSQFSMSKIIRMFLKTFFIEKYYFRGKLFVIDIF